MTHEVKYYYRMANEAAHSGEIQYALELYEQVLSLDPHFAPAWHERGDCLDRMGRSTDAIASYDRALGIDPNNAETWFKKGLVLKRMGQGSEASFCMSHGVDLALGK